MSALLRSSRAIVRPTTVTRSTNHERIAAFWTVRLGAKLFPGAVIEAHEVAACMRLTKESRLMNSPGHRDSLDDIAGYADVEFEIHEEVARRGRDD